MDDSQHRRHDQQEVLLGLMLPLVLAILIIVNITKRTVCGPAAENVAALYQAYTQPLIVWGAVLLKTGLCAGLFIWFWLANRPICDRYIIFLQIVSLGIAAVGLVLVFASLFM